MRNIFRKLSFVAAIFMVACALFGTTSAYAKTLGVIDANGTEQLYTSKASGAGWSWDGGKNLYLTNYSGRGFCCKSWDGDFNAGDADLTVHISGSNTLSGEGDKSSYVSLFKSFCYVTIEGDGALTMNAGTSHAFECGKVTLSGITFTMDRPVTSAQSDMYASFDIKDSVVTLSGRTVIYAGTVSISNSTVSIKAGGTSEVKGTAIDASGPVSISNNSVVSIDTTDGGGYGIVASSLTCTDSKLTIKTNEHATSYYDSTNYKVTGVEIAGFTGKTVNIDKRPPRQMYRVYNPNSGEHFYTASAQERDGLVKVGWNYEGIGWTAPVESNTPVYRLYNKNGGEHHFTTSKNERDGLIKVGWKDEGIGWYSDDAKSAPLYRQYNPNAYANNHNYTISKSENDWLVSLGWRAEGIGWYGVK